MTAVETQSVRRELCQFGSMNIKDRSVSHDVCGSQTKPAGFTASLVGLRTAVRVMQGAVSVPSSQTNPRPRGEVGSKPTCRNEMSETDSLFVFTFRQRAHAAVVASAVAWIHAQTGKLSRDVYDTSSRLSSGLIVPSGIAEPVGPPAARPARATGC